MEPHKFRPIRPTVSRDLPATYDELPKNFDQPNRMLIEFGRETDRRSGPAHYLGVMKPMRGAPYWFDHETVTEAVLYTFDRYFTQWQLSDEKEDTDLFGFASMAPRLFAERGRYVKFEIGAPPGLALPKTESGAERQSEMASRGSSASTTSSASASSSTLALGMAPAAVQLQAPAVDLTSLGPTAASAGAGLGQILSPTVAATAAVAVPSVGLGVPTDASTNTAPIPSPIQLPDVKADSPKATDTDMGAGAMAAPAQGQQQQGAQSPGGSEVERRPTSDVQTAFDRSAGRVSIGSPSIPRLGGSDGEYGRQCELECELAAYGDDDDDGKSLDGRHRRNVLFANVHHDASYGSWSVRRQLGGQYGVTRVAAADCAVTGFGNAGAGCGRRR